MSAEYFYSLLPGVYQQLDAERGQPLRALMQLLQGPFDALEANIGALYDDWFIETCEPWVVPYIGRLVGIDYANVPEREFPIQRAAVANAIRFTRHKGTLFVLQPLVWSATGWYALAVENGLLAANTAAMQPVQMAGRTFDLRSSAGTPFAALPITASIGGIADDVVLYVWRLPSWPVAGVTAPVLTHAGPVANAGMYTFDPLGIDTQLFTIAVDAPPLMSASRETNVPLPVTRAMLAADLASYRARYGSLPPSAQPPNSTFYGPDRAINVVSNGRNVPPISVAAGDLREWNASGFSASLVIDPELGRIAVPPGGSASSLTTSYAYGFAAPYGGGPYERRGSLTDPATVSWTAEVGATAQYTTLTAALTAWLSARSPRAIIRIVDDGTYAWQLPVFIPLDGALTIEAADQVRPAVAFSAAATITGPGAGSAYLRFSGLRAVGPLAIDPVSLLDVDFVDCTFVPPLVAEYDFAPSGALVTPRSSHTATLAGTDVLLAGGSSGSAPLASAELYSTATGTSSATGSLQTARTLHTATPAGNGVVIAGGMGANDAALGSIEIFDDGAFTPSKATLAYPRFSHTATALDATRLVLIGGSNGTGAIAPAEIFDAASGRIRTAGSLNHPRWNHIAIPLANGSVFVAGGEDASGPVNVPELFDGQNFTALPAAAVSAVSSAAGAILANGSTLIAGGVASTGVTSAAALVSGAMQFAATASLPVAASLLTATTLAATDGRVLVAGGMGAIGAIASASLYVPSTGTFEPVSPLNVARASHTATLLPNGSVLIAGGSNGSDALGSTELFEQIGRQFAPPAITITTQTGGGVSLRIVRSIIGAISFAVPRAAVRVEDSILDALGSDGVFLTSGDVAITASFVRATIFGAVQVGSLENTIDTIFTAPVTVANSAAADLSYCDLPPGSNVDGYRCQPMLALQTAAAELDLPSVDDLPPVVRALVLLRTAPRFISTSILSPEYAHLRADSPRAIAAGSSEGSEMGAFCALRETERQALIRRIVDEFLPAGRNAAIVYVT